MINYKNKVDNELKNILKSDIPTNKEAINEAENLIKDIEGLKKC